MTRKKKEIKNPETTTSSGITMIRWAHLDLRDQWVGLLSVVHGPWSSVVGPPWSVLCDRSSVVCRGPQWSAWSAVVCRGLPWSAVVCRGLRGRPWSAVVCRGLRSPQWSAVVCRGLRDPQWSAVFCVVRSGPPWSAWSAVVCRVPPWSAVVRKTSIRCLRDSRIQLPVDMHVQIAMI
jgi:hypothetical protein